MVVYVIWHRWFGYVTWVDPDLQQLGFSFDLGDACVWCDDRDARELVGKLLGWGYGLGWQVRPAICEQKEMEV